MSVRNSEPIGFLDDGRTQGASQSSGCEPAVSSRQRVLRQWTSCRRTVSIVRRTRKLPQTDVSTAAAQCTDQSGTRVPCHETRQTSERICTLCVWQPATSVTSAAVVQRGWRLVLSGLKERYCSEFAATIGEQQRPSSQAVRCSSLDATW